MLLYRPVQQRLSAYCRVVAGNEEKALDLIQETLVAAFEGFEKLRQRDSFLFFLFSIARNRHLKQQRKQKFVGYQSEIKTETYVIHSDSVELSYDIKLVSEAINKLSDDQKEAVLLFHILGFSIAEIAQNLKTSDAAIKNRLMRGRENLRKLLSDKETLQAKSTPNTKAITR